MPLHDVLRCLGNLFIITVFQHTELQCTGSYMYWLAAASGLGSGQYVDLELWVEVWVKQFEGVMAKMRRV